jgi:hypothetical protein
MANKTKKAPILDMDVEVGESVDSYGGLVVIDELARAFGLWEKIRAIDALDPRKARTHGFSPETLIAQLVLSFCSGGVGLRDAEELFRGTHPVMNELTGIKRGADASTLGEWLRAQTPEGVEALQGVIREFIGWVLEQAPSEAVRRDGVLEVFFDDTQLELHGRTFEGAAINYNGERTLSWQTFWVGPFIAAGNLGKGSRDVSEDLPLMMEQTRGLWEKDAEQSKAHFYADSGSSAGKFLQCIDAEKWGWSVSYNKYMRKLEQFSGELNDSRWSKEEQAVGRQGQAICEKYGWVKHQPGDEDSLLDHPVDFAVVGWREAESLSLWSYAFVAGRGGAKAGAEKPQNAKELFARHRLKGDRERAFSELLGDLDLHHPPCQSLGANQMFYTLGMLAYNLIRGVGVMRLGQEYRTMRVRSVIRYVISVPVKISRHARRTKVQLFCRISWLRWWREYFARRFPKRPRGRPPNDQSWPPPSG